MKLKNCDKELLKSGNCYTFALLFVDNYPDVAKKNGFKASEYKYWVDWNGEIFSIWNKDNSKDFFDTEMNFTGREEY